MTKCQLGRKLAIQGIQSQAMEVEQDLKREECWNGREQFPHSNLFFACILEYKKTPS